MKKGAFVALAGITGVGKTTTIDALEDIDKRYSRVVIDTTRSLREGETKRRHVSMSQFLENKEKGIYWGTNFTHGNYYGSPKQQVHDAIDGGTFLLTDYDIDYAEVLKKNFPQSYIVYMVPPSIDEIKNRLLTSSRDNTDLRLQKALVELEKLHRGEFDKYINFKIKSETGRQLDIAKKIHANVLACIGKETF